MSRGVPSYATICKIATVRAYVRVGHSVKDVAKAAKCSERQVRVWTKDILHTRACKRAAAKLASQVQKLNKRI